jgi:hypothetical protein
MTNVVYNIARLRRIPFFTFNPFFFTHRRPRAFARAKQAAALYNPSVHELSWIRGSLVPCVRRLVQGAIGGVG